MKIVVTKDSSTPSSIPIVGGDPVDEIDTETPGAGNFYMPSTYNGATTSGTFSVQIKFGDPGSEVVEQPTFISSSPKTSLGLSVSTTANGFTISGTAGDIFLGAFYEFAMKDGTVKVLSPDTTEDYYALVKYKMPFPTFFSVSHPLTIGIPLDPVEGTPPTSNTISINQFCLWSYSSVPGLIAQLSQPRV